MCLRYQQPVTTPLVQHPADTNSAAIGPHRGPLDSYVHNLATFATRLFSSQCDWLEAMWTLLRRKEIDLDLGRRAGD